MNSVFKIGIVFVAIFCWSFPNTAWAVALDSFAGLEGMIDIAGGTAHIPVMTDAAKNIMAFNPKIRITVEGGGSWIGAQKVGEGLASIGNTGGRYPRKKSPNTDSKPIPLSWTE